MRVLSVSNFFDTHGGGLERVAGHLCREFSLSGHFSMWAASDADGLPSSPAELLGLKCVNPIERFVGLPMPIPGPRAVRLLSRMVRCSDLVVIHDALYITSILAMVFAKFFRRPVVLIQHISEIPFKSAVMRGIMRLANATVTRLMISVADRLVFISDAVRKDLLGVPPRRNSELIFNGVDQSIFNSTKRGERRETLHRWALPTNAPVIVFVGRFVEKKGLRIIRALAEHRPDFHFALLGKGPIAPQEWGLSNVHLLGHQPQEAIAELYRAGDVLLLPSVGEGYPLVVQEAMACGLPVVCGNDSALADPDAARWLTGVDVNLGDVEGSAANCAAAIDQLNLGDAEREAMAKYALDKYSWSRMANAVIGQIERHVQN